MNPHLHQAMIAARTSPDPTRRPAPRRQPILLSEAAPLLSIFVAIAGLIALGATTVPA